jgi:hypothetical protein
MLDNAYRCAICDRLHCSVFIKRCNEFFPGDSAWDKLPKWARSEILNHRAHVLDKIRRDHTIQLYICPDGRKVATTSAWDNMGEDARQICRDGGKLPLKTFWLKTEEKCSPEGIITIIKTPTDDVYWESKD